MSTRIGGGRPLGVTVVVVLTAALALFDLLLGTLALVAAPEATVPGLSPEDSTTAARILGVMLIAARLS